VHHAYSREYNADAARLPRTVCFYLAPKLYSGACAGDVAVLGTAALVACRVDRTLEGWRAARALEARGEPRRTTCHETGRVGLVGFRRSSPRPPTGGMRVQLPL
jgi:hypothetical protein